MAGEQAPRIRAMTHTDLARVVAIDRAVGWPHDEDRFRYLLEDEETAGFVVERDGVVAGFVFAGAREPAGWLGALAVDPAARGHGLGRALATAADAYLRERCDAALLEASAVNARALAIYQRLGYVVTGELPLCGNPLGQAPPIAPPAVPAPDLTVTPLGETDWPLLHVLDEGAYGGWREQDLLYFLSQGVAFARLLRVAGQPRGYCLVERASGRIGPLAAPTLGGLLALLDDVIPALLAAGRADLYLRPLDPDAALLAALAARNLHPVAALRNLRLEKVYRRPIRRVRGYYVSARPEKG